MDAILILVIVAVLIVLLFDYTNGFHDAANIVATVIASRAMTPVQAVLIVGFFEFLGPLLGGTAVANTIGKFITLGDLEATVSLTIILCGLAGAIVWNLLTWWRGVPSSSSHALVGGLAGAVVVAVGADHVAWGFGELFQNGHFTGITKVLLALVLSPLVGFWAGFFLHRLCCSCYAARSRQSTGIYAAPSSSPPPAWPFPTAPTTHRKAWASSPWCCSWAASSTNSSCRSG